VVIGATSHFLEYAVSTFELDPVTGKVAIIESQVRENFGGTADQPVADVVTRWRELTDEQLSEQIGYLEFSIDQHSDEMHALIVESWLIGYPTADVSINNYGSIRQSLDAGPVTLEEIIGVIPFDNVLMDVKLTGEQITQVLVKASSPLVGGMHRQGSQWVLDKTGQPLDPTATYSVLVNNFIYGGGDGYKLLAEFDPDGYNTAIDWRQPVIDWIKAQNSTPSEPLDEAIRALGK
jgi:2',3'-cyclic-nucleotide 2'-phosphodiesterase (5'-nucleotidase family)